MSEDSSSFMNQLIRGYARDDAQEDRAREGASEKPASVGGRSDAGAGQERGQPQPRDMNAWLRDAVQESRGGPA